MRICGSCLTNVWMVAIRSYFRENSVRVPPTALVRVTETDGAKWHLIKSYDPLSPRGRWESGERYRPTTRCGKSGLPDDFLAAVGR